MNNLDQHLDNILKASGSGLRNYSMQKIIDDMRKALNAAIAEEREACALVCETRLGPTATEYYGETYAEAIRSRGEQA